MDSSWTFHSQLTKLQTRFPITIPVIDLDYKMADVLNTKYLTASEITCKIITTHTITGSLAFENLMYPDNGIDNTTDNNTNNSHSQVNSKAVGIHRVTAAVHCGGVLFQLHCALLVSPLPDVPGTTGPVLRPQPPPHHTDRGIKTNPCQFGALDNSIYMTL